MVALARRSALFLVAGMLVAHASLAQPAPATSICPARINLVGSIGGALDPVGNVTIIVNDALGVPMPFLFVTIDFTACSGLQICTVQQPGIAVGCPGMVSGFTNAAGVLNLSIAGHANNGGGPPVSGDTDPNNGLAGAGCATILAGGIPLRVRIPVGAYDHNGGGMLPSDLACYIGDYFGVRSGNLGRNPDRSDYDNSGTVSPPDQSLWMNTYFATGSPSNCPVASPQCAAIP